MKKQWPSLDRRQAFINRELMRMKVTIDRFEGEYAVVEAENKQMINMPKGLIPSGAQEGDVISIEIDEEETAARRERIGMLMDELWE